MNIPQVDVNSIIEDDISKMAFQRQKNWQNGFKLVSFGIPQALFSNTTGKILKIQVVYFDSNRNTQKTKTINFGKGDEYVFTGDNQTRLKRLNSQRFCKNRDNPLSSQYWQSILLMKGKNFVQNAMQIMKNQIQYNWDQIKQNNQNKHSFQVINFRKQNFIRRITSQNSTKMSQQKINCSKKSPIKHQNLQQNNIGHIRPIYPFKNK